MMMSVEQLVKRLLVGETGEIVPRFQLVHRKSNMTPGIELGAPRWESGS
jgi:hypothetical protein